MGFVLRLKPVPMASRRSEWSLPFVWGIPVAACFFAFGCGDAVEVTMPPEEGTLVLTVTMTGTGDDADGFAATVSSADGAVRRWIDFAEADTKEIRLPPGRYDVEFHEVSDLCIPPESLHVEVDGRQRVTGAKEIYCVGQFLYEWGGHVIYIDGRGQSRILLQHGTNHVVSVSPDGSRFVTSDELASHIRSISDPGSYITIRGGGQWSPDGRYILGSTRAGILIIDSASGGVVDSLPGANWGTWSPTGDRIAFSDGFAIWSYRPATGIRTLVRDYTPLPAGGGVIFSRSPQDLLWSPGDRVAAEVLFPQELHIIDMDTGDTIPALVGATQRKRWLGPDSLVVGVVENFAHYTVSTRTLRWLLPEGAFYGVNGPNLSPDGAKLLFSSLDPEGIYLLDRSTGEIHRLLSGAARVPVWLPYSGGFVRAPPTAGTFPSG